jgi:hypothetical protein
MAMSKPLAEDALSTDVVLAQTYFDVCLRADGIILLERTDEVYPNVQAVHQAYDEFLAEVDDWALRRRIKSGRLGTKARSPLAWLVDVRRAPSRRNDFAFERVVEDRRKDLLERSPLLAVLVRTASGKMQMTRMARSGSANLMVFDDLSTAVAALIAGMKQIFG